jgi:hypothetical protein
LLSTFRECLVCLRACVCATAMPETEPSNAYGPLQQVRVTDKLLDPWVCTSATFFSTFTYACRVLLPFFIRLFHLGMLYVQQLTFDLTSERRNICPYISPPFCRARASVRTTLRFMLSLGLCMVRLIVPVYVRSSLIDSAVSTVCIRQYHIRG